ncbi:hypothetical protein BH10ACT1_BH10ACT1_39130 [soil metagenome]
MSWPEGAWTRVSVTVDGRAPTEVSDVWWLVAHGVFADLRVLRTAAPTDLPYSDTQAFAGTCTWDPATREMRWHHLVDTEVRDPDIAGHVWPDADDPRVMHEAGPGFTERWVRIDPDATPAATHVVDDTVAVAVGRLAIVVTATGAARFALAVDTWTVLDAVGPHPPAALPPDLVARLSGMPPHPPPD